MIDLKGVTKTFRSGASEVRALQNVSLDVDTGQFVAIKGPSGSGKSTLLSLIGGLALPTDGSVTVADQRLSEMSGSARAAFRAEKVGFVFQLFHLLPYLNIVDNVLVASSPGVDVAQRREGALSLLERFGLSQRLTHRPAQLSAGERQRVAMARALLNRPALLLADEPTGNLDAESASALLEAMGDYHRQGGTVVLVTHDEAAAGHAERMIRLRHGEIESEST